jgi:hypothetical protein
MSYAINLWGSDPAEGNDDCWTGADFDTWAEASRTYFDLNRTFRQGDITGAAFIEFDGPDFYHVMPNPHYQPSNTEDDNYWLHEQAMHAGMGLGVKAYNDAKGWG